MTLPGEEDLVAALPTVVFFTRVHTASWQSCRRAEESSQAVRLLSGGQADGLMGLEPNSSSQDLLQVSYKSEESKEEDYRRCWLRQPSRHRCQLEVSTSPDDRRLLYCCYYWGEDSCVWVIEWALFPTEEGQWGNAVDASASIYASGIQETLSTGFNEEKRMHCAMREVCPAGIITLHLFCRQSENFSVKSGDINIKCTFFSLFQK